MPHIRRSGPPPQEAAPTPNTTAAKFNRPTDIPAAVRRDRRIWRRAIPLDCGCKWVCYCTTPPLSDNQLDGWALAADFIIATTGEVPMLPLEILRALYRRGGADRALAEKIHAATGGAVR